MKAFNNLRGVLFCIVAAMMVVGRAEAAAPVYRAVYSFTNSWGELAGFNNAGDLLVSRMEAGNDGRQELNITILRAQGTVEVRIAPVANALVQSVATVGMSQRRADGHVFVTGKAFCTDNYWRACVWDVALDGTYVFTLAELASLPADSQLPNVKVSSYGAAVNNSGVVVGDAETMALESMPIRWAPPYNAPQRFNLSEYPGARFVDIDDDGNMLADSIEFERGGTNEHFSGALVRADGTVMEVPPLTTGFRYPAGSGFPTYSTAKRISDDWVVGSAAVSTNERAAFAWRVGSANAVVLPGNYPSWAPGDAWSINTSGQILGSAGTEGFTFWQYENGNFVAYAPSRLIPADSYRGVVYQALINDAGEIAMVHDDRSDLPPFKTVLRVYAPVSDGIVHFYNPVTPVVAEHLGTADFTVQLARTAANTGRVTVNYRTVDGTAKAGENYVAQEGTLTWEAGDSEEKRIKVALIENVEFDEGKAFHLELSAPTGAQLPQQTRATVFFDEWDPAAYARNFVYAREGESFVSGVGARQGSAQVIVRLERATGFDGKLIVTNFTATGYSATEGVDFTIPAGLSATWERGEGGVKTISIPLIAHPEVLTNRFFMVSADVQVEGGPEMGLKTDFGVLILPQDAEAYLTFRAPELVNGKLRMEAVGVQGTTIELLKATSVEGPWTLVGESSGGDGSFVFEAEAKTSVEAEFFRFRQKQ